MLTHFYQKKKIIIVFLIILSLVILIGLSDRERARLTLVEDAILSVAKPLQGGFFSLSKGFKDFTHMVDNYQLLAGENARLREKNSQLLVANQQLEEMKQENRRLRDMLDFQQESLMELIPARVIARDSSDWFNTIIINKGYIDGVEVNMAVITKDGLAGNILSVSRYSSKVLLLTDSRRAVSGLVQRNREMGTIGFVEGSVVRPGYCRMTNIARDADIRVGDIIVSSGLGEVFPQGIQLGEVVEVGQDEYGLLQYAIVKPSVSFSQLEEVFVVQQESKTPLEDQGEGQDSHGED